MPHTPRQHLSGLAAEIGKKKPFDAPEQEALLNLARSASTLSAPFDALFRARGLSGAAYNLLRILRGAGPAGRACSRLGCEMITRVPDVTRLVDRLETSGLVRRTRSAEDRRIVTVAITPRGLDLLASLDAPIRTLHRRTLGHMSRAELASLNRLLVKARAPHNSAPPS